MSLIKSKFISGDMTRDTEIASKQDVSSKNQPNGYAGIDSSGKIPVELLPASLMSLKGPWNASTNTPTLSNTMPGVDLGDVYEVVVGGTVNFGNGPITFAIGDWAVYDQYGQFYRSPNSNTVSSVNGYLGSVVLGKADVGLGNVSNLAPEDLPVSTATQTALNNKVSSVAGLGLSQESYTTTEKTKLSNIQNNATANLPDSSLLLRSNHTGNEGILTWDEGQAPSVPTLGLSTYAKSVGGRQMFAQLGKSGVDYSYQPFLGRNRITSHQANGNATTLTSIGSVAPTAGGTATARNVATTNKFTWMRRVGYVSATTGNASAGLRSAVLQIGRGNLAETGGFHLVLRFGVSDTVQVPGARLFAGLTSSTAVLANGDPSTLTNIIGVGTDAADTNLFIMHNDGVNPSTKISLGASFPETTNSIMYELALYCAPNGTSVFYDVLNMNTNVEASGEITTDLPLNTQLLAWQVWRHNVNTGVAVGIDVASVYIETDN